MVKEHPKEAAAAAAVGAGGLVIARVLASRRGTAAPAGVDSVTGADYGQTIVDHDQSTSPTPYTPTPTPTPAPAAIGKRHFGDPATLAAGLMCPGGSTPVYDKKAGTYGQTTGAIVCRFADGRTMPPRAKKAKK